MKKKTYITWRFNPTILNSDDYKLNNKLAKKSASKNFIEICKKYTHISYQNMEKFIKFDKKIYSSFNGIGIDLGGGIGLLSSIIAKKKKSRKNLLRRNC